MTTINPNNDRRDIKVYRTTEGTVFELMGAVIVIILWALTLWFYQTSPDKIPTHFDITGTPDAYGDKSSLILLALTGTAIVTVTLCTAYFPRLFNTPVKISNAVQYAIAIRMVRIISILCGVMFLMITVMSGCGNERMTGLCSKLLIAVLVLILLVTIYYTEKMRRAGKKHD
ncbi:DUF1648 domain-containing protein [Xylanibacter muris]|uniref:DUF1648 domain-containing protein n=1 Tax=Xylanibacter muris TaxID=2736290 RepID=A0ABX2AL70_9BACT|nr:DUF1648 domain-containing protein [Xylanibacter muris]NPD91936.1 DUF1648 domain-containing protein [Xylanibacter muris]